LIWLLDTGVAVNPVGTDGGVLSAKVVAETDALRGETFPSASIAATAYV
jgi:hypothetical protein